MMKKNKKHTTDTGLGKGSAAETWVHDNDAKGSEPGSKPADKDQPQEAWLDKKEKKKDK